MRGAGRRGRREAQSRLRQSGASPQQMSQSPGAQRHQWRVRWAVWCALQQYTVMVMQQQAAVAVQWQEGQADDGTAETSVAIGPTMLSSDTFSGVGGASGGGGGTRLLVDYPAQQRSDILDMLFKPQFGASLQHLKVEVGCDGDTTQGSEPTHARSATDIDFDRGYEVWFMEEAVKRRADIQLSGLEWGVPGCRSTHHCHVL